MSKSLDRARVAARSAHALMHLGDTSGAVNRAYYAMFAAAKAGLENIDPQLAVAKTHATIIRRFGRHLVEVHGLDAALGRHLNAVEELRLAADYSADPVEPEVAQVVLSRMDAFLFAIESFLSGRAP